ncbi:MAG: hypothetical protein M1814_001735 [Vezdaea aestivalis]|nr:MAG: hypothetical protein M1814_001735 [Vezdaea aestivalis]
MAVQFLSNKALEDGDLGEFIRQARYGPGSIQKIFKDNHANRSPALRRDQVNRIIVYSGSYNPLQIGHVKLLRRVFAQSGPGFENIIAALIHFVPDEVVRQKILKRGADDLPMYFNMADRIRMWNGGRSNGHFWTYDDASTDFRDFQARLIELIDTHGFKVTWVGLWGADTHQAIRWPRVNAWACDEVILSNVGRRADFIDKTTIPEDGKDRTCMLLGRLPGWGPWEDTEGGEGVKICYRSKDNEPPAPMRLILDQSDATWTSSTKVRQAIQSSESVSQLVIELEELVPYPELLVSIMKLQPWASGLRCMQNEQSNRSENIANERNRVYNQGGDLTFVPYLFGMAVCTGLLLAYAVQNA